MTNDDPRSPPATGKPVLSDKGRRAEAERQARAAAALRENLARRKRQQRARAVASKPVTSEAAVGEPDLESPDVE